MTDPTAQNTATRSYARAAGLPDMGDELVLEGVSQDEARERIDAARWNQLRHAFGVG